ncbi:MAG: hypothetical protein IKW39_03230 [Alphaproteobacteria bacterium]|nr:hypothetical protein [Alphaproteobacteria bacterium]
MAYNLALIVGLKIAAGFLKSEQERQQYKAMAAQELQNAEILRENAYLTRVSGAKNEDISRAQNRAFIASNMAIASEAGMAESPTTMTNLAMTASVLEQNVLNNRFKVESEAENYLYQARVNEENARVLKKKYKNSFASSLLSSVSLGLMEMNNE